MKQLNLPSYHYSIKSENGSQIIFDRVRKKFVTLTPEEWVRQNFINYLIEQKHYPESMIANEMEITLYGLSRRCDSVIFSKEKQALMIIEFKAPEVNITQKTFEQIASYNLKLKVKHLIISNGLKHFCLELDKETNQAKLKKEIPEYSELQP